MIITQCNLNDAYTIEPKVLKDKRGYFFESFRKDIFKEKVADIEFVQENESGSVYGTLRGLHYQVAPFVQSKLVSVVKGEIIDVIIDLRKNSQSFGKHFSVILSGDNKKKIFIPGGFAHGFVVLTDEAIVQYKTDSYYSPECERGIKYNDPRLGIDWKIPENKMIISEKDRVLPLFENAEYFE